MDSELKQYAREIICLEIGGAGAKSRAAARILAEGMLEERAGDGRRRETEGVQPEPRGRHPWSDLDKPYAVSLEFVGTGRVHRTLYVPAWMGVDDVSEYLDEISGRGR